MIGHGTGVALEARSGAHRYGRRVTNAAVAGTLALVLAVFGLPGVSGAAKSTVAKGTPIKLGAIMDVTGGAADPLSITISNDWAKWTNAHGGIDGHPVKLTVLDDASTPATALSDAKQLVQQDHVIALIGSSTAVGGSSLADYLDQVHVPEIGGNFGSELTGPDIFPVGVSQGALDVAIQTTVKESGASSMGDFYCTESPNCATLVTQHQISTAALGIKDVLEAPISSSSPDYTAQCLALLNSGAQALEIASFESVAARLIPTCTQQGFTGSIVLSASTLSPAWDTQSTFNTLPLYLVNAVWNPADQKTAAQKAYTQAVRKYSPSMLTSPAYSADEPVVWVSDQMFTAAALLGKITPKSKPAAMVKALYKIKNNNLGGTTGPITYSQASEHVDPCYFVMKIAKGTWTDPLNSSPLCLTSFNKNPNG
jgi:branched-chain amino acid transport system substrate-binding protein